MFLQDFIKEQTLKKLLKVKRTKTINNLEDIKEITIQYSFTDEAEWKRLEFFLKIFEIQQKNVTVLGIYNSKNPLDFIVSSTKVIMFDIHKDVNWLGLPKEEIVQAYVGKHYQLMIDATAQPNYYSQYFALRTQADLKVTHSENDKEEQEDKKYDLYIRNNHTYDLHKYLTNTIEYLLMIQK